MKYVVQSIVLKKYEVAGDENRTGDRRGESSAIPRVDRYFNQFYYTCHYGWEWPETD